MICRNPCDTTVWRWIENSKCCYVCSCLAQSRCYYRANNSCSKSRDVGALRAWSSLSCAWIVLWMIFEWSLLVLWVALSSLQVISVLSLCNLWFASELFLCVLWVAFWVCSWLVSINLQCAQNTFWVHFEWSLEGQWICSEQFLSNHWIISFALSILFAESGLWECLCSTNHNKSRSDLWVCSGLSLSVLRVYSALSRSDLWLGLQVFWVAQRCLCVALSSNLNLNRMYYFQMKFH